MSTKVSYAKTVYVTENGEEYNPGFFTWNLMKCFGDPKADKDGDGKTSMKEAYYYLLQINPKLLDESISKVQNPQLIVNEVVLPEPEQTTITIPDMGIEMELDQPLDENAEVYIKETSEIENTDFSGDNIVDISNSRYYSIDLVNQYSPFNMDITFTYDSSIDSVWNSEVDMGLVKRDSAGVAWEKIPSVHLPDINKVKATDITGFSDFAFAHVIPEDISDIINSFTNSTNFKVYPNPTNHLIILNYNLEKPGNIEFSIMDISGRTVRNDFINGDAGNNIYFVDLSSNPGLKPGVYFINLYTQNHIFSKIILVE